MRSHVVAMIRVRSHVVAMIRVRSHVVLGSCGESSGGHDTCEEP